ncbi:MULTISPECIES: ABC transporter ATP-binding protein [unclassified Paenibacillus]|uniref:ABC transporter ATP-binding protein n=1 Tax=unclassified Paenibacillus TaxID=185978 RepID=UPI002406C989|nr:MULTISPECIES: ABC transporter ATP-binding protein [unclassified Paenibacillus]MDF9842338.1 iron complex transport system ATP-binding protein [Paenibacillus sp. PastF-2]MDF9848785.1 iron complex transport system ATP-binding protein [Paenibacillus sp. PastM-2]MDF9855355.1 iron complex transport system ATP-binding protein [Paenibacillus sp. PastF-1]MDH6480769.1 iron complex transport system ATP-binding protein [Paenibacillus sp. PastH-2]MDH6508050.1 iron complex transport system ATP-binding pr
MDLNVERLAVSISNVNIVKDVSLKVRNKQFVGLIGPNGCGKSTLLKSIYKVIKPKQGDVFLSDLNVIKASPKAVAQKLGVVGQFNELSFDFKVREMVAMGRTPHKGMLETDNKQDHDIVTGALRKVNLEDHAERSYNSLSGGEKQRVILARVLAQQPEFMILDEPTNHLDIKFQLQILNIVKKLDIGILAALHDLTLAAQYCDYLYVMKQGQVAACGKPEDILTKELIGQVFDVACETYRNPVTGALGIAYLETT